MYIGKTLFAQLMDFLPWKTFHRISDLQNGDRYVKSMACTDQFRVLAFAQLTYPGLGGRVECRARANWSRIETTF